MSEPQVAALSFFGHGTPDKKPTLARVTPSQWKNRMFGYYVDKFLKEGLSQEEAAKRARGKIINFGLELVRNNSCYSLSDTSIADLFVKPGGDYYGVKEVFLPCPALQYLLSSHANWTLTRYHVEQTSQRLDDPRTPRGKYVDRCLVFGAECDDNDSPTVKPAATEFCRRMCYGALAPSGSRYSSNAPNRNSHFWRNMQRCGELRRS